MTEQRKNAVERLNRPGEQWTGAKEDADKKKRLENEIFTLAWSIFGKLKLKNADFSLMEGIVEFLETDWGQFDAAKGSLYGFFLTRLHNRAVNEYRKQSKDALTRADSLDASVSPGEEPETISLLDQAGQEDEYPSLRGPRTSELMAVIIHFQERLRGRSNNPERRNCFRMFFTDGVSDALRRGDLEPEFRGNGREGKALKSGATITNQRNAWKLFLREILGDAQAF